jgi:hypothetical protein
VCGATADGASDVNGTFFGTVNLPHGVPVIHTFQMKNVGNVRIGGCSIARVTVFDSVAQCSAFTFELSPSLTFKDPLCNLFPPQRPRRQDRH